jgi:nicotinate-nucleotide adenylyltransferase
MNARVGIFGGTFNPIHVGHLRAAEEVVEALDLERLIFVPCAEPPHKRSADQDPVAPAEARLSWVRLAVGDNTRFCVDPLEVERGGPSYSVDTLRAIGARTRPELPVFVVGQDAFLEMGTWREPAALFTLAHFAVITRPPGATGSLADWLPEAVRHDVELAPDGLSGRHRRAGTWLRVLEITALEVSASDIRRRLREGRSVRYLLPEGVRRAVAESGVYGRAA